MANSSFKSSFWSFLVYPEWYNDCEQDFIFNKVISLQIPGFIGPCHDLDKKSDGSAIKPHYHVYIKWSGPTTYNNVLTIVQSVFPEVKIVVPMNSVQGSWDYCRHAEHDTKINYDVKFRLVFNGFDVDKEIKFSLSDEERYISEILEFCQRKRCYELSHLILFCRLNNPDWYKVVRANTYFFKVFMDSFRASVSLYTNSGQSVDDVLSYLY